MRLFECFDKHGSDKGSDKHHYDRVYEPLLQHLRQEQITLLEIGVLRGASLAAWLEYFPSARIIGVDTFGRVPADAVPILKHDRVTWFACDSAHTAPVVTADVIIDDGNHCNRAQLATFRNYFPLLNDGGVYFIEDVTPTQHKDYRALLKELEPYSVTVHGPQTRGGSHVIEVRHG